jgi:hypothetical protein
MTFDFTDAEVTHQVVVERELEPFSVSAVEKVPPRSSA